MGVVVRKPLDEVVQYALVLLYDKNDRAVDILYAKVVALQNPSVEILCDRREGCDFFARPEASYADRLVFYSLLSVGIQIVLAPSASELSVKALLSLLPEVLLNS